MDRKELIQYLQSVGAKLYKKVGTAVAWYRTDAGFFVRVEATTSGTYKVSIHSTCGCGS